MRKINGKLFLGLLLGTAVLTGAVFAVHYFQYQRIARAVLWQANRAEEQGKVERMARYLQRYLEFNPHDDTEKARLGQTWASETFANAPRVRFQAVRLLDEVLLRDESRPDLRRLLVKTALDLNHFKLARGHLEKLLPWKTLEKRLLEARSAKPPAPDKNEGELVGYWGHLLQGEGKPAEAVACCRLAVQYAPDAEASAVRLSYLLRGQPEIDPEKRSLNCHEADQVMDALVAANEHSHKAYLARWRYRRDFDLIDVRGKDKDASKLPLMVAAEDVAGALKRAPEDVTVLLAAADLERLHGDAVDNDSKLTPSRREKLHIEHRDQAYAHLQRGLDLQAKKAKRASDSAQFQLLWHKGNLLLDDLKRLEEAGSEKGRETQQGAREKEIAETIEQLRKTRGLPAAASFLQGRLRFHERRWAEAATLFEQARALLASQPTMATQANLYLGHCYEKLQEPNQMYEAYKNLADLDKQSTPALLGMAAADWSLGRLDGALSKFQQVMNRNEMPARSWIDVARLEIQRQMQKEDKNRDWASAEDYLKRAEKANAGSVHLILLRAGMMVTRDQPDEADLLLTEARDKQPARVELWTALADLAMRGKHKDPDRAKAVLDEASKKLGDRVDLRLARARLIDGPADRASAAVARLAEGAERFNEEDRARLLSGLAETQLRINNIKEARALWEKVIQLPRYRTDLRLRMLLFDLALKADDEPGMDRALAEMQAVERTQGAYHRCGGALRLIWKAKRTRDTDDRRKLLSEARIQLDHVLTLRPSWPAVFLARAEIAELSGNPEQAINDLREAINKGEATPGVIQRLATLLYQQSRSAEADQELNRLRESLFVHSELGRLAATVALQQNQQDRARKLALEAVKNGTKDPRELVWLGRLLAATGHRPEAEEKLRKAVEVAPAEPMTWVALVQFLAAGKRRADALEVIREARARLAADKVPLALAQCHEAMGNAEEARKQFQAALEAQSSDVAVVRSVATFHLGAGRIAESEPLLRRIVDLKVKSATPNDVEWAKRGLAVVLAASNDFQRFRQALDLVGVQLDAHGRLMRQTGQPLPTDLRRAQARVLATQGQRQFRKHAIDLLKSLQNDRALMPDDQYVLALLYDADGDWTNCRKLLGDLVRSPNVTPQYLAQFSERLIRKGNAGDRMEAEGYVKQLAEMEQRRKLDPNAFASIELKARLLEARKKGEEALDLLKKHIRRPNAKPEEVFLVLASLSRQKRHDEAFRLVARAWENDQCPPEASGGVSVALLREMKPTDAQVQRVETWLKAAIAKKPRSMVLRMHLADMYDLRGRYQEAERQYREVLQAEPANVVALNNLAWQMAQHADVQPQALEYVTQAIQGLGRRPDLLDTRGLVHLVLGHTDEAVADLKEAVEEAPTATRLFHLARAQHKARNRLAATHALEKARQLGLQVSSVHPKEQAACRQLFAELNVH